MRRLIWGFVFATALVRPLFSQADSCRGALSALDRVKEEITPELGRDASDSFGRDRLKILFSTVESASRVCPDIPELFYYRSLIAERLGDKREAAYSQRKQKELNYQPSYNPFTPSAAQLTQNEPPPGPVRRKWALIVGVNEFQDKVIESLKFAVKDSQDFAHFLLDPKGGRFESSRVKTLTNEEATVTAFWEGFGWLRSSTEPNDLVVIYLASHGSPRQGDPNGVSFILLNNSQIDDKNKIFATSIEMVDLVEKLNRELKARRVVLFLDTCFSGDASEAGRETGSRKVGLPWVKEPPASAPADVAYSGGLSKLKAAPGRAVITASRADELSWEGTPFDNGYFTHFLLASFHEGGSELNLGGLFAKLRSQVSASVKQNHPGVTQTPSGQFDDRSEKIVISVPEQVD